MNKKGKIVILLVVILIIVIALNYFISSNTVYLGNNTKVLVIGNKIIKLKNNRKILLNKVSIYKDGKKFDGYLKSEKYDMGYSYYAVSKYNKKFNSNDLVASGKMVKMNAVSSSNIETSFNVSEINSLLELKLENDNVIDYKKVTFDIDNDSNNEEIVFIKYIVDNIGTTKAFVVDNEDITDIVEFEYDYTDMVNIKNDVHYLSDVIDLNNDKKYEIILARIDGDSQPTYYDIYSYENGNIKEIK
ncbi:MAG: hypothetical protein IKZ96_01450 [Bacilli bacterium]|nr:hypothetical protein [Bacilli bacterium]